MFEGFAFRSPLLWRKKERDALAVIARSVSDEAIQRRAA
jgi:hypothetical protein